MEKTPQEEFMAFVQEYPECYAISKSDLFMRLLGMLKGSPRTMTELVSNYSSMEEDDVRLMVLALESAGLARKTAGVQKVTFVVTEKGLQLLEKFLAAKNAF